MTHSSPLRSRCFLPPEEEARRLALYHQGLTDKEIGAAIGLRPRAVALWRWKRGLPANRSGDRRLELYHQGLSDVQIAAAVGRNPQTICDWRQRHGLPPNETQRKGCRMEDALTPEQCAEMRLFLTALVALHRELPPEQKPDVARFMAQWRKLRNQLYPMISDAVRKNPRREPKEKTQLC